MRKKIPVGILGATGLVGQQLLLRLRGHPWFQVVFLAGSRGSEGKKYGEYLFNKGRVNDEIPEWVSSKVLASVADVRLAKGCCELVFSALPSHAAREVEERYAKEGLPVISNAAYHRFSPDVPMIIPEVNPHHLEVIPYQRKSRGWDKGCIIVKPNCSLQSYLIPLHPLHERFKVTQLIVTTMQALSGAGYSGLSSLDMQGNVVPYISQEEEKSQVEPLKIWGEIRNGRIIPADGILISAHCNRVPVVNGHIACVSVKFEQKPGREDILSTWREFMGMPQKLSLPSAPKSPLHYMDDPDRPQPQLDVDKEKGMAVSLGRLRDCNVLDYRFTALSHNTIRGAAGGAVLTAELFLKVNSDLLAVLE